MSLFDPLKAAIPRLWTDKATIIGTMPVTHGYITDTEDEVIVEDEPCKVILKSQSASTQTFYGTDDYDAKLLIRNGIKIPAGSIIKVTDQNGNEVTYKLSGAGYTGYHSHQELVMKREEKA